jgi:thiamine biosynthesis lipoprotein ApbE
MGFDPWALPDRFDTSGLARGWIVERVLAACLAEAFEEVVVEAGVTSRLRCPR